MGRSAIIIVTYKRQELLSGLLDSTLALTAAPWRVFVIDNEASPETAALVEGYAARARDAWGVADVASDPDAQGGVERVVYVSMESNTGGSGGFSEGVHRAFEAGADWFWVMDDDVAVEPNALAVLQGWAQRTGSLAIQGQRYDFDGGPFFWQYRFWTGLGIYNPLSRATWQEGEQYKLANALCFEGAYFSRELVEKIGLPDPRFFVYFDDALYGYLASKVTDVLLVPDYVLSRRREVTNAQVGTHRQLNSTSNMTRYYITRNRGYLARYYQVYGDYRPVAFGVGTLLTFAKELIRLLIVDRGNFGAGWARLWAGYKDQRRIQHDPDWKPMPPLG